MPAAEDFSNYYKTISNAALMHILNNPDGYEASAVEAAKNEFFNRHLSDSEIQLANEAADSSKMQQENQREKILAAEHKLKTAGNNLLETLHPVQSGIRTREKTIRFIAIFFTALFLYSFIKDFRLHQAYIKDFLKFPSDSILHFFPLVLLPFAVFAFWRRKTAGWMLLIVFLSFSIVAGIWLLMQSIKWKSSTYSLLNNLFPRVSPIIYIIQLAVLTATMYVLCKAEIREIYIIGKEKMLAAILLSALAMSVLMFALA